MADGKKPGYGINIEELADDDLMELKRDLESELKARVKRMERNLEQMRVLAGVLAINGERQAPVRKGKAKGGTRKRGSAGKNEGMSVPEAVQAAIKELGGQAPGPAIAQWFEKKGDQRTVNLSALAKQGYLKVIGKAERREGTKGAAPSIYTAASETSSIPRKGSKRKRASASA